MRTFEGLRQLDLEDLSSKIPVSVRLLRSALLVTYQSLAKGTDGKDITKESQYKMRYMNIDSIIVIPTGLVIDRKAIISWRYPH